jgi:hypothetical protein
MFIIGVDNPKQDRGSQKSLYPILMGLEQAEQAAPLQQMGKQIPIVPWLI